MSEDRGQDEKAGGTQQYTRELGKGTETMPLPALLRASAFREKETKPDVRPKPSLCVHREPDPTGPNAHSLHHFSFSAHVQVGG